VRLACNGVLSGKGSADSADVRVGSEHGRCGRGVAQLSRRARGLSRRRGRFMCAIAPTAAHLLPRRLISRCRMGRLWTKVQRLLPVPPHSYAWRTVEPISMMGVSPADREDVSCTAASSSVAAGDGRCKRRVPVGDSAGVRAHGPGARVREVPRHQTFTAHPPSLLANMTLSLGDLPLGGCRRPLRR
jgi:hypothetical protein